MKAVDDLTIRGLALQRLARRARVRIKLFKISREQAIGYAAYLCETDVLLGTEDSRSQILGKLLAGRCNFDGIPIRVS